MRSIGNLLEKGVIKEWCTLRGLSVEDLIQGRIKAPIKHLWWSFFAGVVGTEGSVVSEHRNLVHVFS